ncbi:MAG: uroporphyrinogen-III C-methyltransferase [Bacteroidota bacterium]|nr:uroporphyrinogen-III C-methyltransferase [Bacteroidota bacterium]
MSEATKGKVILVGAGPGDPDLITIKAVNYLQQAEIVLTDRLVSTEILNRYVSAHAIIIEVGKQCRRGISTPQPTINELLVYYALQGKLVVRLKGGDVAFFSNVLDELETLVKHNIAYEIVPGITAASGASAYAGIPLTARDHATAVRFLTYHKSTIIPNGHWKELASTDDTLIFYMSSETLDLLVDKLVEHNAAGDKELAVIEQATTPYQQVYSCRLHDYVKQLKGKKFLSPSLVIVGKVVGLQKEFAWFNSNNANGAFYFKPLTGVVGNLDNYSNNKYADRA